MPCALICKFSHISPLASLLYHSAGNLLSGVSGGLSMEVIWITVNNHSPSNHLAYRKPTRFKGSIRISLAPHQRRQISSMFRMCLLHMVVVAFRSRESSTGTTSTQVKALLQMRISSHYAYSSPNAYSSKQFFSIIRANL